MGDRAFMHGYSGYIAHHDREARIAGREVYQPKHKYTDCADAPPTQQQSNLLRTSMYSSTTANSYNERTLISHYLLQQQKLGDTAGHSKIRNQLGGDVANGRNICMDPRNPKHWQSTNRADFTAQKPVETQICVVSAHANNNANIPQKLSAVPQARNLLRNARNYDWGSAYERDYGEFKPNPLQRVDALDEFRKEKGIPDTENVPLSSMSTSKDLFAGTAKGTGEYRIPGYQGYVPNANTNRFAHVPAKHHVDAQTLRGTGVGPTVLPGHWARFPVAQPVEEDRNRYIKDHLVDSYRPNVSGYTGHNPKSVANVVAPRSPTGAKPPSEPVYASLILDSMKL